MHGSGIGTGFYRDGFCSTGPQDEGRHTVCIEATEKFLAVSAAVGVKGRVKGGLHAAYRLFESGDGATPWPRHHRP